MHCLIIIRTVWSQFLQIVRFSGSQWKKSSSIWCIRLYSLKMVFYKIELIIFSTQGWQTNLWADIFVGVIVCFRILSHLYLFWLPFHRYHLILGLEMLIACFITLRKPKQIKRNIEKLKLLITLCLTLMVCQGVCIKKQISIVLLKECLTLRKYLKHICWFTFNPGVEIGSDFHWTIELQHFLYIYIEYFIRKVI